MKFPQPMSKPWQGHAHISIKKKKVAIFRAQIFTTCLDMRVLECENLHGAPQNILCHRPSAIFLKQNGITIHYRILQYVPLSTLPPFATAAIHAWAGSGDSWHHLGLAQQAVPTCCGCGGIWGWVHKIHAGDPSKFHFHKFSEFTHERKDPFFFNKCHMHIVKFTLAYLKLGLTLFLEVSFAISQPWYVAW